MAGNGKGGCPCGQSPFFACFDTWCVCTRTSGTAPSNNTTTSRNKTTTCYCIYNQLLLPTSTTNFYNQLLQPTSTTNFYNQLLQPTSTTNRYYQLLQPTSTTNFYNQPLLPTSTTNFYNQLLLPTATATTHSYCQYCNPLVPLTVTTRTTTTDTQTKHGALKQRRNLPADCSVALEMCRASEVTLQKCHSESNRSILKDRMQHQESLGSRLVELRMPT